MGRKAEAVRGSSKGLTAWFAGYDAYIFDCDGVLLDSNTLKVEAFRVVLSNAGCSESVIDDFSEFQRKNFGTSRHRLFEQLLSGTFGPVPVSLKMADLLRDFGDACARGYLAVPETDGMAATIAALVGYAPLYVVSGSDEAELVEVFRRRGLFEPFQAIYGSPRNKRDNVARVLADIDLRQQQRRKVLFIGDAAADLEAAIAHGLDFLYVTHYSTVRETLLGRVDDAGHRHVETLADLWTSAHHTDVESAAP